jgi:hypothetical protein
VANKLKNRKMYKIDHIQKVIGIIFLLFIFNACDDVLDQVPSDKVTIDRILNKSSVSNFKTRSYESLDATFANYSGQLLESYTDDAFRAGTGTTYNWHSGLLSPSQSMFASTLWEECWKGIRSCNNAIVYLPQSTVSEDLIDKDDIAKWVEEVKVLRAWYHFTLIKYFGAIPFIEEAFEADFDGWAELTRPTYDEIANRIIAECDEVISNDLLPLRWQASTDYDNVNMAVAYALKARVALYMASELNNPDSDQAKWQVAATAAQECIDAITPEYELLPIANYANLFNEAASVLNSEIILRSSTNGSAVMNNNNGVDLSFYGSATQSNNCGAVPSQELVDCFEFLDGSLPVQSYNADHTQATLNSTYSENEGDDIYAGKDARFYQSIVYNGAKYGRYKGMDASASELTIYTYEGKAGTGFNFNPLSQEEIDKRMSCTGYYTKKYRSASYWGSSAGGTNSNKIYFRLAEVYLNLAEAQCELNNLDAAITALNVIRARAGQPNIETVPGFAKTQDFLLKRIRNERRVELCFEGHRFHDQRRWKILSETNGAITGMKITSSDGTDVGNFSYERVKIDVTRSATSDKYLILPLPLEEARRLPGIGQPSVWN